MINGGRQQKQRAIEHLPVNKCIICGWKGRCDKHRIKKGGEYIPSNVIILCPNCHRLAHDNLLVI